MSLLHQIENMSFAELKEHKEALLAELKANPPGEALAARYLQARTDAKMRDEKLAEQGQKILEIRDELRKTSEAFVGLQSQWAGLQDAVKASSKERDAARAELAELAEKSAAQRKLIAELTVEKQQLEDRLAQAESAGETETAA